jgi:hypothetical protein
MVKILEINDEWIYEENSYYHVLSSDSDIAKIKYRSWKSLQKIFPSDVIINIVNPNKPTDIFYHGLKLFVSYKIAQIALKYDSDLIEFFPVNIIWNGDEYTETSFFLMNVMDRVDCINRELSEYITEEDIIDDKIITSVSEINKLVLYPIDENIHKIFFIDHIFSASLELAVSDDVAQEILAQNCNGLELIDISSYRR